jgi:molecular chaperone GrpE
MAQEEKKQNQTAGDGVMLEVENALLTKKLEDTQILAEEYLNNWKRERADFINYKKDEAKRSEEFVKFANEGIILEILDIIDDLEITARHEANGRNNLEPILKKLADWLKKYGVVKISISGGFDPNLHEAIKTDLSADGEEDENKLEEFRAGYTMHGKVIRPARVKIIN